MLELIRESISAHQLPMTVLLGIVVLYWLMVIFGLVDLEGDVFELGDGVGEGGDGHVGGAGATGGMWVTAGRWLGFSQVPIAVWGSFAVLFTWVGSLILNYRYNGVPGERDGLTAILLMLPSGAISLVMTKLVTMPVGRLFAAMADADLEGVEVVGQVGTVTTGMVDERHGQVQISSKGAPVLLQVRVAAGMRALMRGEAVRVMAGSADGAWYLVEPLSELSET